MLHSLHAKLKIAQPFQATSSEDCDLKYNHIKNTYRTLICFTCNSHNISHLVNNISSSIILYIVEKKKL